MSLDSDPRHVLPATRQLRRSARRWRLMAFVALAVAVLAVAGRFAGEDFGYRQDHIARIVLDGVIAAEADRLAELEAIADDQTVKAVIVAINSPGGTTAGGEELYEALGKVRAEKPVAAMISELGASAAYMTAIAGDRIFARRLSMVGSIGVYYAHVDLGGLMRTIGVDYDKVQTGPLKAEPDIDDPLTGPARESLQVLVDDSFDWFVAAVAERRGMDAETVRALADGRIMTGRMALDAGLIDAIGGEAEAIAWLESARGVAEDLPIRTHYPFPENSYAPWLSYLGAQALKALGLSARIPNALDGLVSLWQADSLQSQTGADLPGLSFRGR